MANARGVSTVVVAMLAGLTLGCGDDGGEGEDSVGVTGATNPAPTSDGTDATSDGSGTGGDSTTSPSTTSPTTGNDDTTGDDTMGTTTAAGVGCDDPSFIVCEDFEGATLGGNPAGWDLRPSGVWGGNTMGASDEQSVSGNQSFRLAGGDSGAQWLTYMGDISAFADGHWGRMYFRMSNPVPWPAGGGVIHGDMFEARGDWNGSNHQVRWAVINNNQMQHNWGYNVQTSNAGEFIHETGYEYSWTEDWLCIEWHHDQAAQQATLWVDGEMILDVVAADDPQLPTFDDISVGWANYQSASPEFVVFIDDVVLDDERVGCG